MNDISYLEWIRARVGQRKIFLAFASVVLQDEHGRVLLQHRTDFHTWGLPGGILEPGETISACARRELLEETGLTAGELSLVGVYSEPEYDTTYPNGDQVQQYTVCFRGRLSGGQMRPDGVETSDQRFFDPAHLPFERLPKYYAAMLRDALNGGEPAFAPPFSAAETHNQIESIRPLIGNALYIGVGTAVVIRREDGRLLLVRRRDNGQWVLPGGYSHLGENAAYTALREAQEEAGLLANPERLLCVLSPPTAWVYPNGDRVQPVVSVFQACWASEEPRPDQDETTEVAWMTPAEFLAQESHPMLAQMHLEAMEGLGLRPD